MAYNTSRDFDTADTYSYMSNLAESFPWSDWYNARYAPQSYHPSSHIPYVPCPHEAAIRGLYYCPHYGGYIHCAYPHSVPMAYKLVLVPVQPRAYTPNYAFAAPPPPMPPYQPPYQPSPPPPAPSPYVSAVMRNRVAETEPLYPGFNGKEQGESSSGDDGTKPFINQLDQPIMEHECNHEFVEVGTEEYTEKMGPLALKM